MEIRKGAADSVYSWIRDGGGTADLDGTVHDIAQNGGTPLVVAVRETGSAARALGVVELSDVVKPGIAERVMLAALDKAGLADIDNNDVAMAQFYLLMSLAHDEQFSDEELDSFLMRARRTADIWLAEK